MPRRTNKGRPKLTGGIADHLDEQAAMLDRILVRRRTPVVYMPPRIDAARRQAA